MINFAAGVVVGIIVWDFVKDYVYTVFEREFEYLERTKRNE